MTLSQQCYYNLFRFASVLEEVSLDSCVRSELLSTVLSFTFRVCVCVCLFRLFEFFVHV